MSKGFKGVEKIGNTIAKKLGDAGLKYIIIIESPDGDYGVMNTRTVSGSKLDKLAESIKAYNSTND